MSDWKTGREYDDLIDLPHPVSGTHPQMSARDRAGQFAPFAALTGLEDAIAETARLTDDGPDLSEESKQALSDRLRELRGKHHGTAVIVGLGGDALDAVVRDRAAR